MGLSPSIYIGPFVKCKFHPTKAGHTVKSCPKTGCPRSGQSLCSTYCPDCGTKIEGITVPLPGRSASHWEVLPVDAMAEFHTEGESNGEDWLVPNRSVKTKLNRKTHFYPNDDVGIMYESPRTDPDQIEEEIDWFRKEFAAELEALEKAYDKVAVCWGVLNKIS